MKSYSNGAVCTPRDFIAGFNQALADLLRVQSLPASASALGCFGLPREIAEALSRLETESHEPQWIVVNFLHALLETSLAEHFERGLRRLILSAWKNGADRCDFAEQIREASAVVTDSGWNDLAARLNAVVIPA